MLHTLLEMPQMPTFTNGTKTPEEPDTTPPPVSPNALAVVRPSYMEPLPVVSEPAASEDFKTPLKLSIREVPAESRILITDDNAINRKVMLLSNEFLIDADTLKLLVAFMKKYKLQYSEAENGLEALRIYQEGIVRFDIILMGECRFFPVQKKSESKKHDLFRYVNACHGRNVGHQSNPPI